jgi:hypothetical protein
MAGCQRLQANQPHHNQRVNHQVRESATEERMRRQIPSLESD